MLPNIILILIRFHYFARSSLYSTERCTVKSFGRSTGAQSLSSPVAQSPCRSVRITLKRTTGRLQHASRQKWLEHVLSKPRQKEESLHWSFPLLEYENKEKSPNCQVLLPEACLQGGVQLASGFL